MDSLHKKTLWILCVAVIGSLFWQNKGSLQDHFNANTGASFSGLRPPDEPPRTFASASSSGSPGLQRGSTGGGNDKDRLLAQLTETKSCYQREDCDFPNTDPKSYEIAIGQKIKNLLLQYQKLYGKEIRHQQDTERLAHEYMRSEDHFVQEVALHLFANLPTSAENLRGITESLRGTVDPLLVEQAMNEMKRYMGTPQEAQVHLFLQELLREGAVFSSEQAVRGILSFVNPQSFSQYEKLARSLPENSSVGKDLRSLLEEYRRMRTGG